VSCWKSLLNFAALVAVTLACGGCRTTPSSRPDDSATRPPNVVIIFCDDLAYADIAPFGAETRTPNLSQLAREGRRFTDFYVGQPVCSASRAALLTGCYPNRVGIMGALPPRARIGINPDETTIAEILKGRGYATAIFGKWHLGDAPQFLPTRHGFDEFFGLPYSNDMWPFHPVTPTNYPPLPLYEGERVVQLMPDQTQLTTWYTERAVDFIERKRDQPFFLYLAHNMPHVPLFVSRKFDGKSGRGVFADVIMEIDWSVGEVMRALKRSGLDDNTLVVFTSDNGPWLSYGNHAGSALPLREGKGTTFEGGVREPTIMRWPGRIPPGSVCREMAWSMDLLPTVARLAGTNAPADRIIDGKDIWPLISGQPGAKSPHPAYYYYWDRGLEAVRAGRWKLHFAHDYRKLSVPGGNGKPGRYVTGRIAGALYDLEKDPGEANDLAAQYPAEVARLRAIADEARDDLGDSLTKRPASQARPPGRIPPGQSLSSPRTATPEARRGAEK
jgi:arylsulfatase A